MEYSHMFSYVSYSMLAYFSVRIKNTRQEKKCDLSDFSECGVAVVPGGAVWVFPKLFISWDFHAQELLKFKQNGEEKQKKTIQPAAVLWIVTI